MDWGYKCTVSADVGGLMVDSFPALVRVQRTVGDLLGQLVQVRLPNRCRDFAFICFFFFFFFFFLVVLTIPTDLFTPPLTSFLFYLFTLETPGACPRASQARGGGRCLAVARLEPPSRRCA